jgi:hypothetical protein
MSGKIAQWSEAEKAFWILENGYPDFVWIFERVDHKVFKRPSGGNIPPWISAGRTEVTDRRIADAISPDAMAITTYHINTFQEKGKKS